MGGKPPQTPQNTVPSRMAIFDTSVPSLRSETDNYFSIEDFDKHNIFHDNCPVMDGCDTPVSAVIVNAQNGSR